MAIKTQINKLLSRVVTDFGGGCSVFKANLLAKLIVDNKLKSSIDIGVYRGRSLFPQALAHKSTKGIVYGIDPYSNTDAIQVDREDIKEQLSEFASKTQFENIYNEVRGLVKEYDLESNVSLIRKRSGDAVQYFIDNKLGVDLIHIDGNHDEKAVKLDYDSYSPLLNKSGFLVLDDISWQPIRSVYKRAGQEFTHIFEKVDGENDFAVFYKAPSKYRAYLMKAKCYLFSLNFKK